MTTPNLGLALIAGPDTIAQALITKTNANMSALDTIIGNKVDKGAALNNLITTTAVAGGVPLVAKGILSQSGNLQEWRNSVDTVLATITKDGSIVTGPVLNASTGGSAFWGPAAAPVFGQQAAIITQAANIIGLSIQGYPSQSSNLQQWQDSSASVLAKVSSIGQINAAALGNAGATFRKVLDILNARGIIGGATTPSAAASLAVLSNVTTDIGLIVQGIPSQSGDLTQWQNSSNGVLAIIDSNGAGKFGAGANGVTPAQLVAIPVNASTLGLVLQGFASQTADFVRIQDSSGNVVVKFRSDGRLQLRPSADNVDLGYDTGLTVSPRISTAIGLTVAGLASQSGALQHWRNSSGTVLGLITSVGGVRALDVSNTADDGPFLSLISSTILATNRNTTTNVPLSVRGMASQTGNLTEYQNSSGTVLSAITAGGRLQYIAGSPNIAPTFTPAGASASALYVDIAGSTYRIPVYV